MKAELQMTSRGRGSILGPSQLCAQADRVSDARSWGTGRSLRLPRNPARVDAKRGDHVLPADFSGLSRV